MYETYWFHVWKICSGKIYLTEESMVLLELHHSFHCHFWAVILQTQVCFRSGSYLSAGTCLVSLATLCLGSHDKIHQAILLSFYVLQVIKNWSWGRHEAKTLPITRRAWKRCLIDACTDCTCTSTVTNRQSWWNSFSPGRYPFAVKSKWLWFVSVFIRPDYLRCVGGKLLECWYSHVNGRFVL